MRCWGLVACLVLGACGPVEYISQVSRRATSEVAAARAVGAPKLAPYEYTKAQAYLSKAREEAGYSDYQAAIRFGRKATELALEAQRVAAKNERPSSPDDER